MLNNSGLYNVALHVYNRDCRGYHYFIQQIFYIHIFVQIISVSSDSNRYLLSEILVFIVSLIF